jgi:hypothetical protein
MYKNLTWTPIYIVGRASNLHLFKWDLNLALEIKMGHLLCWEASKTICIYFHKGVMNGWKHGKSIQFNYLGSLLVKLTSRLFWCKVLLEMMSLVCINIFLGEGFATWWQTPQDKSLIQMLQGFFFKIHHILKKNYQKASYLNIMLLKLLIQSNILNSFYFFALLSTRFGSFLLQKITNLLTWKNWKKKPL